MTIVGRLTGDPTLRFAPSGTAVCDFTVVTSDRKKDDASNEWKDVNPTFFRCKAFKTMAENIAESLTKGTQVIVVGKLYQEKYTSREGDERTSYQNLMVDECGPSLTFATAQVRRGERGSQQQAQAPAAPVEDPWATPAANQDSEPPF